MGRCLIKLNDGQKDWYMEWSTVSDAPSYGMSLEELTHYTKDMYGKSGLEELVGRLERCDKNGHSLIDCNETVYSIISFNRAGKGETCLTADQIVSMYCYRTGMVMGHRHSEDDSIASCDGKGGWR